MLKKIAPFLVIAAGCMWGSIGVFVRYLDQMGLSNTTIVEIRMIGAALMLFFAVLLYDKKLFRFKLKDSWVFIGAGLASAIGLNYFYNLAIQEVSLSFAAILLSTMPIFVLLISFFLFKEDIARKKIISVFLMILGCICVSGFLDGAGAIISLKGILFGLISGIGYAFCSIFIRIGINKGYSSLTINLYCFVVACLSLLFFTDWHAIGAMIAPAPPERIGFLIFYSFICAALPYALYFFSFNHMDTGKASILASCEPAAATVFGFIYFSEVPTVFSIFGILIVFIALALMSRPDKLMEVKSTEVL